MRARKPAKHSMIEDSISPSDSSAKLPVLEFSTLSEFEAWLATQPDSSKGAWLKFAKRVSDVCTIAKQDAVDCALCHGWIDGQLDKLDEKHWLIRFSPRTKTSKWSEKNRARANELIAKGRMRKSGLREIARAKQDGRWDAAYPSQSRAVVPADLQRALDENTEAKAFFLALDGHNRYAVLYRVHNSKNAKSRAANIAKFVAMLERGETIHHRK
jgi:uncharacterized protein YdeI (YjbR/CyaY-like superfamily)